MSRSFIVMLAGTLCLWISAPLDANEETAGDQQWNPRVEALAGLVKSVKGILDTQDPQTGRFGSKPWICNDQNVLLALAAAWSIKDDRNPWYHDPKLLNAIIAGGDALVDDQDPKGMWTFRKKDNSTWGQIYMPWTYSRWVRAYLLIKDAMPPDRRAKWDRGLLKGFEGISKTCLKSVHNIPCHHAMGLYAAGLAFNREEWKKQAAEFMGRVVAAQSPDGWWSEHLGPVVSYNFVYSEALGVYYAMSGDEKVLEALRRAAIFHANLTYPDGSSVETVDERNPYHAGVRVGNVGFSMTPEGRGFLLRQLSRLKEKEKKAAVDEAFLLYGKTGEGIPTMAGRDEHTWTSRDGKIVVLRKKPWFVVASGYTAEVPQNRWIQDRQNFVSVFHDTAGLIVGGGNTKLQPYWSNFTIGDPSLLKHKSGDTNPNFIPPPELIHVPSSVKVTVDETTVKAVLEYGKTSCEIEITCVDAKSLRICYRASGEWDRPVEGHITLLSHLNQELVTARGASVRLEPKPFTWSAEQLGPWFRHGGWQLSVPDPARLMWPVQPHNPYKKDGSSTPAEGRLVLAFPLAQDKPECRVLLTAP